MKVWARRPPWLKWSRRVLVAAAMSTGCSENPPPATQVFVVVDAIEEVKIAIGTLRVIVRGGSDVAGAGSGAVRFDKSSTDLNLPFRLALTPAGGDTARGYSVTAEAYDAAGSFVSMARIVSGYTPGTSRYVRLLIEGGGCLQRRCPDASTCRDGECTDATIDPTTLSSTVDRPTDPNGAGSSLDDSIGQSAPLEEPADDGGASPGGETPARPCGGDRYAVDADCVPRAVCEPGTYVADDGSPAADRLCAPCPRESFSAERNARSCARWTLCTPSEQELVPGTSTNDRQCVPSAWTKQIGTPAGDDAQACAVDSGGAIYVVGTTSGAFGDATPLGATDVWLAKYDPAGNEAHLP
jgi:hypothetical protein